MKLREVQKALGLHYLNLNVAIEAFDAHGLRGQNDKLLDVPDMITVLSSLYETISAAHPTVVNVPLCLDLTLNWMLNVYDWYEQLKSKLEKFIGIEKHAGKVRKSLRLQLYSHETFF